MSNVVFLDATSSTSDEAVLKFHTLPLHVGDLMKETAHLSNLQFGVYMRLVLAHFHRGPLGIETSRVPTYARTTAKQWEKLFAPSVGALFTDAHGFLRCEWLVSVLQDLGTRTRSQRDKALKRWRSDDAEAPPTQNLSSKNQTPEEEKEKKETTLYEQFPNVETAAQFVHHLPEKWKVIAASYGVEPDFLYGVAAGFWERFVGRYAGDPLLQEKFTRKKNWERAWEFECDRLDRIKRNLPSRKDLPMQRGY